jgi:hypothetical protein
MPLWPTFCASCGFAGDGISRLLRAEVDRAGYDIVLHCNGVLRHVQLKSSHRAAATSKVDAKLALGV